MPQDTQTQPDPIRIELATGATLETIAGALDGQNQARYVFWAEAGQTIVINVTSPNNGVLFHLEGISDGQVYKHLLDGESEWQGAVLQAQDYLLVLNAIGGPTTSTAFISIAGQLVTATPTPAGEAIPGGPLYKEGWAIDENTMLVVDGRTLQVHGQGHCYYVQKGGEATVTVAVHVSRDTISLEAS